MESKESPLVILPAAGFGRRMGSPESKEILPLRKGQALIDQPLQMALDRGWPVLLVTRREKISLLDHVKSFVEKGLRLEVCFVGETQEWPESLLKSSEHWRGWNLVALPDTEYRPLEIWDEMWRKADSHTDLVVAQHEVEDSSVWGVLEELEDGVRVGEKQPGSHKAWGLYLFTKAWGERILRAQLKSQQEGQWLCLKDCRSKFVPLNSFQDLTRG